MAMTGLPGGTANQQLTDMANPGLQDQRQDVPKFRGRRPHYGSGDNGRSVQRLTTLMSS